jgi:hypothetical protein
MLHYGMGLGLAQREYLRDTDLILIQP